MRSLTAALLIARPGCSLQPGRVVWDEDGIVRAVERAPARTRLDAAVITPGLVNAHLHGQIGPLPRHERSFVPWLRTVMGARVAGSGPEHGALMQRHLRTLQSEGCTAVGEIDSLGISRAVLESSGIAGRCYRELVGFDVGEPAAQDAVATALASVVPVARAARIAGGLSPHAPYSVSPALLRSAADSATALTVHVAESEEEVQFARTGRGPLRDLLEDLERLPAGFDRPATSSAVDWLARAGALRPTTSLVHCQHLDAAETERVAASGAAIVVCPSTIDYFDRRPPPIERWLALGIPVAIGTDSAASSRHGVCSIRADLVTARRLWPAVDPERLLEMVTAHGAAALALGDLGRLQVGHRADLVVWDGLDDSSVRAAAAAIVEGEARCENTWCGGRLVHSPNAEAPDPS